jgi:predicted outer membrane repeat protein
MWLTLQVMYSAVLNVGHNANISFNSNHAIVAGGAFYSTAQ